MAKEKTQDTGKINIQAVLPVAPEIERFVLGAMFSDNMVIDEVVTASQDHNLFTEPAHKIIYGIICRLHEQSQLVDLLTVRDELEKNGKLKEVGGLSGLVNIVNSMPATDGVGDYVRILIDKSTARKLILECHLVIEASMNPNEDIDTVLTRHQSRVFDVRGNGNRPDFMSISEALAMAHDQIKYQIEHPNELPGHPTGLKSLDKRFGGYIPGQHYVVAGRPGMGKTAFALYSAVSIAKAGIPVAFFSHEMVASRLAKRTLAAEMQVDSFRLLMGNITDEELIRLSSGIQRLSALPLYIIDRANIDVFVLESIARRLMSKYGIKVLFNDYLQQMKSSGRFASPKDKISHDVLRCQQFAKDTGLAFVNLSQLSRQVESRSDKRPSLGDLKETGAIEETADMVMFPYRPEYYGIFETDELSDTRNVCEMIVAKNRDGDPGSSYATYLKQYGLFSDYTLEYAGYDESQFTDGARF